MKNKLFVILPLLVLCVSCDSLSQSAQTASFSAKNSIKNLEQTIPKLMQESVVPGLSAVLIADGKQVWQKAFGVMNVDTKAPVTNETIFEAASLTKIVTAYAAMILVDQGKLSLDTPLNKYLGNNYDCDDLRVLPARPRRLRSRVDRRQPVPVHGLSADRGRRARAAAARSRGSAARRARRRRASDRADRLDQRVRALPAAVEPGGPVRRDRVGARRHAHRRRHRRHGRRDAEGRPPAGVDLVGRGAGAARRRDPR